MRQFGMAESLRTENSLSRIFGSGRFI